MSPPHYDKISTINQLQNKNNSTILSHNAKPDTVRYHTIQQNTFTACFLSITPWHRPSTQGHKTADFLNLVTWYFTAQYSVQ